MVGVRAETGTHSPFAQALIRALETEVADGGAGQGDGVLSATELYQYLFDTLRSRLDLGQTPGLWTLPQHEKGEYVFVVADRELRLEPAPALDRDNNPWLGLESYSTSKEHQRLFFGRDAEIEALAARVAEQPFVAVLGASGTGKSSLVKAGLLPYLQRGEGKEQGSAGNGRQSTGDAADLAAAGVYAVLPPFRPGNRPVRALAAVLREGLGGDVAGEQELLELRADDALAVLVGRWSAVHPGRVLVLTADQCEELVTLAGAEERARFLRLLACAVEQHPDSFRLVITLRSDFEPQLAQDTPLAQVWRREGARYFVPAMSRESLRQVIEGPAAEAVLFFDPPQMVDELIDEVDRTPGGLPLLSYALSQLYLKYVESQRNDRTLIRQDYVDLGGVVGSLRQRATGEYDKLPDDAHRRTMQQVMLRMVAVEGGELARRRVALSELEYPTEEENAACRPCSTGWWTPVCWCAAPPITRRHEGEAHVEPAHDALVLAWDKLLRWKKEAEEYLPLQRRLAQAATEWTRRRRSQPACCGTRIPRLPQVGGDAVAD